MPPAEARAEVFGCAFCASATPPLPAPPRYARAEQRAEPSSCPRMRATRHSQPRFTDGAEFARKASRRSSLRLAASPPATVTAAVFNLQSTRAGRAHTAAASNPASSSRAAANPRLQPRRQRQMPRHASYGAQGRLEGFRMAGSSAWKAAEAGQAPAAAAPPPGEGAAAPVQRGVARRQRCRRPRPPPDAVHDSARARKAFLLPPSRRFACLLVQKPPPRVRLFDASPFVQFARRQ